MNNSTENIRLELYQLLYRTKRITTHFSYGKCQTITVMEKQFPLHN